MRCENQKAGVPAALYETHTHTTLCRHARGEVEDYAAMARTRGLTGLIVTCHNPLPDGYSQDARMYPHQIEDYFRVVERARNAWVGEIDIRLGLECDYVEEFVPFLTGQVRSAQFDYLLGSIHPHIQEFMQRYHRNGADSFFAAYFDILARAAESGLFDCLSHPDVVKNVFAADWHPPRIMGVICRALDRIAKTGIAMELNTSGLDKEIHEMNPAPAILAEMRQRQIPVVIGSDAHIPERVAWKWPQAMDLLQQAGYTHLSYFLERKRHDVAIAEARHVLKRAESPA